MTPLVLERILDLVIPLAMLGWAWTAHASGLADLRWVLLAALGGLLFAGAIPLLSPLTRAAVALYAALERWRRRDSPLVEPVVVSRAVAARVSALSIARYFAVVLQFFGMGAAAGIVLDATTMFSAAPLAMLSSLVGITPGGLGVQEAGWAAALHWLGQDEAAIALFVLATRALIICNFAVLSALSYPLRGRSA